LSIVFLYIQFTKKRKNTTGGLVLGFLEPPIIKLGPLDFSLMVVGEMGWA